MRVPYQILSNSQSYRNHLMSDGHQNKASEFVTPKSEPIELPKPSTPLQVQYKDGEPVVDDSLVLLDWCKCNYYSYRVIELEGFYKT